MNPLRLALNTIQDVTIRNSTPRAILTAGLALGLWQSTPPVLAAPAGKAATSPALSFNLTTSIGYSSPGETPLPPQQVAAKVMLHGNKARVETQYGGQPTVVLFSPPYVYRLLPKSKAGVRYTVDAKKNRTFGQFSPQELIRNPGSIRTAITQGGGRKVKSVKINKQPVDVYEIKNFRGEKGQTARAWLRTADALPVRFEVFGGNLQIRTAWTSYRRLPSLPATYFAPPPGYRVRQAQGQPPFSQ